MRVLLGFVTLLAAAMLLYGCGSTSGSFLATALGITVDWQPTRAISGPDAALSGVFTIVEGSEGGHDVVLTFNRDVGSAGGTRRYQLPGKVKVGTHDFVVNFYSESGGQGSLVATASGTMTVYPNGTSSLDTETIIPGGTLASVAIDAEQSILVGATQPIAFTVRDSAGNIVAIPPGAAQFHIVSGGSFLSISGTQGTGLAPGVAVVTVTVNQGSANPITSPEQSITVLSMLNSVTLNPASVTGGTGSTGTVTLNATTANGFTVALSSSNTGAATVPQSVTVPAGATSATFPVTTVPVASDTGVTITATAGQLNASGTLTVLAPVLTDLTLSPTTVLSGNSVEGTVTLSGPVAANSSVTVTLSSSGGTRVVLTLPANVVVPAGSSSMKFTIDTRGLSTNDPSEVLTITATYNGVSKSAQLTVYAPTLG